MMLLIPCLLLPALFVVVVCLSDVACLFVCLFVFRFVFFLLVVVFCFLLLLFFLLFFFFFFFFFLGGGGEGGLCNWSLFCYVLLRKSYAVFSETNS